MIKVNLGCGESRRDGFINLDWKPSLNPDILHDLNKFPYPFEDSTIDYIEASHIIEHLDKPFNAFKELHRILKPGGKLMVKVPHFSRGLTHTEHTHGFDVTLPLFFNKNFVKSAYIGFEFELEKMELHWFPFLHCLPHLGYGKLFTLIIRIFDRMISYFANLNHYFCSRIWCYWVGGFDEIEFHFICKK